MRENDAHDTDHAHGNAIWVSGGAVRGGRVYGDWPVFAPGRLYQDRDLAVTTDFLQVPAAILERRLRLSDSALAPSSPPRLPPTPLSSSC